MNPLIDIAAVADIPPGTQQSYLIAGKRVLVCHDLNSQRIHAIEDKCSHAFQPLAGGAVRNGLIYCPKHGACFDLTTGQATNAVTKRPIKVHTVQVQDGRILVSPDPLPCPAHSAA